MHRHGKIGRHNVTAKSNTHAVITMIGKAVDGRIVHLIGLGVAHS